MPAALDLDLAAEHLDRCFGLDALWLFGSRAGGAARVDSDVDLADLKRRTGFFARTISMYEDLKIARREAEQALFRRIAHGRS